MTENELYISKDLREALDLYAQAERRRMTNPLIRDMITWKSLAQRILRNELIKRKYMTHTGKVRNDNTD